MRDGKKGTAQTILYDAFEAVGKKTNKDPMDIFNEALENIKKKINTYNIYSYYDFINISEWYEKS